MVPDGSYTSRSCASTIRVPLITGKAIACSPTRVLANSPNHTLSRATQVLINVVVFVTAAVHLLLPIANAFPPLHLGPVPIHLPMLLYPLLFVPALTLCSTEVLFRRGF